MSVKWFVIHCKSDDSHVVVEETTVVCEDSVAVGDSVNFSYPGVKHMLDGTVKGISKDYDAMVKLQNEVNATTKPRRDRSFHNDRPRVAALKCKEKFSESGRPKALSAKKKEQSNTQSKNGKCAKAPEADGTKKASKRKASPLEAILKGHFLSSSEEEESDMPMKKNSDGKACTDTEDKPTATRYPAGRSAYIY